MAEVEMIYCSNCGAPNSVTAEVCTACSTEIIRPHPIQLAGGEIYILRCTSCGLRLPVVKTEGTTTCASCGLTHTILTGEGYITVSPAPGSTNREVEQEYLLADEPVAIKPPIVPELSSKLQEQATAREEKNIHIKELETIIRVKTMQRKDRVSRRKGGRIILILSLIGIIAPIVDTGILKSSRSDLVDPIIFIVSVSFFIIGFVLMLASGKKGIQKLEQEINTANLELESLLSMQKNRPDEGGN